MYDELVIYTTDFIILYLAFMIFIIIALWKVFEKAGKPGWGCLIPIYNAILMMEIADRPSWWFVLLMIPGINIIIDIIISFDIAKAFGQGTVFGFGLLFLPFIFFPILAFGSAEYEGIIHLTL